MKKSGLIEKIFCRKETEYPVFNLEITRDKFHPYLKRYDSTSDFIGEFLVYNSGKLKRGLVPFFHTDEASLRYAEDHIHFPSGGFLDIEKNEKGLFLKSIFETPHLTLEGFYEMIKMSGAEAKEETLENYIKKFNSDFEFNSIASREKTRIKLLENAYRKYVSNQ